LNVVLEAVVAAAVASAAFVVAAAAAVVVVVVALSSTTVQAVAERSIAEVRTVARILNTFFIVFSFNLSGFPKGTFVFSTPGATVQLILFLSF
jgi:hypothetical protein